MTAELIWRDVPGFPGYQMNTIGQAVGRRYPGRIMRASLRPDGRYELTFYANAIPTKRPVHIWMAATFLGPRPPGKIIVRHLNDIPTDNRIENLAYGTYADNAQDSIRNGRNHEVNKTECKRGHPFTSANTYVPASGGRYCRKCAALKTARLKAQARARPAEQVWNPKDDE